LPGARRGGHVGCLSNGGRETRDVASNRCERTQFYSRAMPIERACLIDRIFRAGVTAFFVLAFAERLSGLRHTE
jgi:hypothetical protein